MLRSVEMSKLGKPIASNMAPPLRCPSPASSAPIRRTATLLMKNGLSRLPRFSIRIGLDLFGLFPSAVAVVRGDTEEAFVAATGTAAPHRGQYFALTLVRALEQFGHS